ncbi:hypothetical protein [Synechococcus sp. PCC 6312]|uniref:hypothetical protein n=1 Tax=Synechococcus sp. (strain ATCC 27167 / PCC 6312) TaxID=195253 RepID=UPI0002F22EF3|nr:hypothetical protein [Synechococcus sp. PCC 6312]
MRTLIDTNIILDFLLERPLFFEDAVQIFCAVAQGLDAIVTRDTQGFSSSPILVLSVQELLIQIKP